MADAHGFTQMVDYIEGRYSPDEWTSVSPGASADPMLCVMIVPSGWAYSLLSIMDLVGIRFQREVGVLLSLNLNKKDCCIVGVS